MGLKLGQPCPSCGSVHCTAVQHRAEKAEAKLYELQNSKKEYCDCGQEKDKDGKCPYENLS